MPSDQNPYQSPLPTPPSRGERETAERLNREGLRYAVMSLLISLAAVGVHLVLCCWPVGIFGGAVAIFVAINAYNRSTDDMSRVIAGLATGMACLTAAMAIWGLVAMFVRM